MKFYITEEGKKELEDEIIKLKTSFKNAHSLGQIAMIRYVLLNSVVMPVEENWDIAIDRETILHTSYPNGLIIEPSK